jgi:hypothetical protein
MVLDAWALSALPDGGALSSTSLRGKVVLVMLAPSPCEQACVERQAAFGLALKHTDDLGDAVHLLTVAAPGTEATLAPLAVPGSRWHLGGGDARPLLRTLREGWARWAGTDAGQTEDEFSRLPAVALVDQDGAVRGFWHDDPAGRGNAINGARLLARRGPTP